MRKSFFVYFAFFFVFINAVAQPSTGIKFQKMTLQEALDLAKKEHKMVFIHGFAEWCPHCKTMAESVYPDSTLGNLFNSNFINLKLDVEKEGKEVGRKYGITKYPGLLFLDPDGSIAHRTSGEQKLPAMLQLGKDAIDPEKQYRTFENKFNSGLASTDESRRFFIMKERSGISAQKDLNNYFSKVAVDSLTKYDNWRLIFDVMLDPTMPLMKTVITNKKAFEEKYTADSVNMKLISVYNSFMLKAAQQLDTAKFESLKVHARSSGLDIAEKICAFADLNVFKLKGDYASYASAAPSFVEKHCKDDGRKMSDVAKEVADHTNDKQLLELTEQWAKQAIKLMDIFRHNYNLAYIQQKLGKKADAQITAKHALEQGQKAGIDTKLLVLLMEKIDELP